MQAVSSLKCCQIFIRRHDIIYHSSQYRCTFRKYNVCSIQFKYMVMSRDQNARQIHSVRIDNSTFERVEEFKYLGTSLTNQNSIAEEIKSRLRSGSACYHMVQNLLSCRLLSKTLKIKIYRIIILPVVLYACETWSLTLQEERKLRVF